jgi:quercetin dioxygenase-like cupin family protein
MKIIRNDERPSSLGQTFTGKVTLERVIQAESENGATVSVVHFEDGARTNWHVHPGEQILYVLEGEGRVGTETEQYLIYPGDVVYEGPGVRHWHGAARGKNMTHISITNVGSPEWFEGPEEGE